MQVQPKKVYYRGKALVVGNDHYDQVKPDLDMTISHYILRWWPQGVEHLGRWRDK